MDIKYTEKFKFDYANDSSSSYLIVKMDSNENVLEYQVEMISNNSFNGILPIEIRYKNNEVNLYYNITSKLTLAQFLQIKTLNKVEFISILEKISKTILESKNNLLYDSSFLIHEDYIYIDPGTYDIGMVYVPINFNINPSERFKEFLSNLIMTKVKFDENTGDNFLNKILNYLKRDIFNISDFQSFIQSLKGTDTSTVNNKSLLTETTNRSHINNSNIDLKTNNAKETVKIEKKHKQVKVQPENNKVNEQQNLTLKKEIKDTDTPKVVTKKRYKRIYILLAIISQILIALTVTFSLDSLIEIAEDEITAYAAVSIIVVAVDFALFRWLFKKEHIEEIQVKDKTKKKNKAEKPSDIKTITEKNKVNMSKKEIHNEDLDNGDISVNQVQIEASAVTEYISEPANETVVLGEEDSSGQAYLQRVKNGTVEKLPITKSNLIIGRHPNFVDYLLDSKAVGRTHAEIIIKEGQYYIKDLNSKNGTFINNERIISNKEYRLNNEDKVKFANKEFTFIIE